MQRKIPTPFASLFPACRGQHINVAPCTLRAFHGLKLSEVDGSWGSVLIDAAMRVVQPCSTVDRFELGYHFMNQSSAAHGNLAPAEEPLLAAVLVGRRADLQGEIIRASALRDLVTEVQPTWVLPAIGIMLNNAMIQGTLDLEGCSFARPLVFQHCKFRPIEPARGVIQLRDPQLKPLAVQPAISPSMRLPPTLSVSSISGCTQ